MDTTIIEGNLADIPGKRFFPARITVSAGVITAIQEMDPPFTHPEQPFILPGFIDSHVHIESSMLVPAEFARLAVVHGTVATVSDPHEIANVCGMAGVEFMIGNGRTVPFKFNFGAPSCVPATIFETAGASLNAAEVDALLQHPEIRYLSEMMNFPGVLSADAEVMSKIASAHRHGKPVDGHAPGLRGADAKAYIDAGISTDHECFTAGEALEKLNLGMKILIREGSAARNFDALIGLLQDHPEQMMFCSDDKHPDSLVLGHINQLCARAIARGIDVFSVLRAACVNPVLHYGLPVGLLRVGDPADLILVRDLKIFEVMQTWIDGVCVAAGGVSNISAPRSGVINQFNVSPINSAMLAVERPRPSADLAAGGVSADVAAGRPSADMHAGNGDVFIPVIEALDGQLITNRLQQRIAPLLDASGQYLQSNPAIDVLKMVVVNRYRAAPVAKAFIRNFGLVAGALASSVAHDSHNIVAVGVDDESLARAINAVIGCSGGISAVMGTQTQVIPLPVAGLMSNEDGYGVADAYTRIDRMSKQMGSKLGSPFMTLSFMALLVIPHLKLSDLGLFDGDAFGIINEAHL